MNVQFRPEPSASVSVKTAIADCDIHPARATNEELFPFMATRWHEHLEAYGKQAYHGEGAAQCLAPRRLAAGRRAARFVAVLHAEAAARPL